MKAVRINQVTILDKNEKCINTIQFNQEDLSVIKTPKEILLEENATYKCAMCGETHQLDGAKFAYQKFTVWDGKTATMRRKDGTEVQVMEHNKLFEDCGEDEFTATVVQPNKTQVVKVGASHD